ncbi:MAG: POTRA domain-containing protein [Pirellulaceae bacterium]
MRSDRFAGLWAWHQQIIDRYLGQPITLRNLNQMARDIILHYRDCKQPIVDVAIPEQRITGGTVHVVVTETRIDRIVVQPGCYFDCCELSRWIHCTQTGDRIYEPNLESDLFWLNQNPFRRVTLDFQPGANIRIPGVIFKSCDVRPLRELHWVEMTRVCRTLNYGRYFGGFQYGNLFHRGGTLGYQYTTDEQFNRLNAHSGQSTNR